MYCKECGDKLPDGAKFCGNCGAKTDLTLGDFMDDDMAFCPECGEKAMVPDENSLGEENVAGSIVEQRREDSSENEKESKTEKIQLTPLVLVRFLNQKADRCLRTGKGRLVWGAFLSATVLTVGVTVFRGVVFYKNFGWLYQYDLSENAVETMKKEAEIARKKADENEAQYQELKERYEELEVHDLDKDWETSLKQKIVELSVENQMELEQIKADVMNELGYQYTPVYSQREFYDMGLDFRDGLIDELGGAVEGGSIVSSGLKEALNAAAEEAALDNILDGAKRGLADGIVGYVEDKVIGDLGGTVVNIFNTTEEVKSTIESMGNVPPEALNQMSDNMKSYVTCMQDFVSKERITQEDMHEVYQAVCGYRYLNQTLKAMMSDGEQLLDANDVFLAQRIQNFASNQEQLRRYIEMAEELGS